MQFDLPRRAGISADVATAIARAAYTVASAGGTPQVGMLFLVPGIGETLRINGRAGITTDPAVLTATAIDGVTPKVAVLVEVDECYIHCAKALRRSGAWEPATWLPPTKPMSPAAVIVDQIQLDVAPEVIEADLERDTRRPCGTRVAADSQPWRRISSTQSRTVAPSGR